ncbi:hypothetical protein GCM10009841_04660 [Microlunatus panaciterrae]|uniref:Uncharacterized protein n=1 Tax=Microlunatus panaciterrae TaxID=400768 RepID=A0ABS2RIQ3_9ACTN|nr:hypothetical protein [Microlunatus panaciterrae]MBM7798876.1 hypothetical protein [Microlunatus panaciterrae]
MKRQRAISALMRLLMVLMTPRHRSERGLSQSTENAILLAGAVAVAGIVVAVITAYVRSNLPGQ